MSQLSDVLAGGDDPAAPVSVVRVLARHGFGTVEPGQLLAARGTLLGEVVTAGDLLRGALDAPAVDLARSALSAPGTTEAHVAEDDAVAAGLACAGGATLLAHPLAADPAGALARAFAAGVPAALASTADGAAALAVVGTDLGEVHGSLGAAELDEAVVAHVRGLARRGATATDRTELAGADVLVDLWVPVPSLLVVGAGAIADALEAQAGVLGWGSRRLAGREETTAAVAAFTDADVLVLLDHDPGFDDALLAGLRHGHGFLGALGSRRTQAARRERLLAAGVTEADLARIHGPVGLDLGARTPAETAVSIVAEVIAARSGREPGALSAGRGQIGA
ncbi:XdhC family protein [Actinomycetospora sp. TBRC 11914]|uniref:XdhC family protein n=1 Tax=Actinomycetospora sp. TBRC 11914 TaxID=2729387 RepID=UPI00145CF5AC|nr:XdhC family protein [Actinomycetospora sp. TBRC 11914]NMO93029.1 XdhC/CoxF family protein [Actinomycetospora sp. TBRC 11914]